MINRQKHFERCFVDFERRACDALDTPAGPLHVVKIACASSSISTGDLL